MVDIIPSNSIPFADCELKEFEINNIDHKLIIKRSIEPIYILKLPNQISYYVVTYSLRGGIEKKIAYDVMKYKEIMDQLTFPMSPDAAAEEKRYVVINDSNFLKERKFTKNDQDLIASILNYEPEDDLNSLVDELNKLSNKMGIVLDKILRIWGKEQQKQALGKRSDWIEKAKRSRVHYAYMWNQLSEKVDYERFHVDERKGLNVREQELIRKVLDDMKDAMNDIEEK